MCCLSVRLSKCANMIAGVARVQCEFVHALSRPCVSVLLCACVSLCVSLCVPCVCVCACVQHEYARTVWRVSAVDACASRTHRAARVHNDGSSEASGPNGSSVDEHDPQTPAVLFNFLRRNTSLEKAVRRTACMPLVSSGSSNSE